MRVSGFEWFGLRAQDLGFGVEVLRVKVESVWLRGQSSWWRVYGSGFLGFEFGGSRLGSGVSNLREKICLFHPAWFGIWGLKLWTIGVGAWGLGIGV